MWHDNEKFLKQPTVYARHGLTMKCFPSNSGDLNPIETVWAWLRKDLAKREMADLSVNRTLSVSEFLRRAAQILHSYEIPRPSERACRLEKLIEGKAEAIG